MKKVQHFSESFENEHFELKDKVFNYVIFLLTILPQIRMNHWQTKLFSEHKMTDSLYDDLSGLVDDLGESTMGIFDRPDIEDKQFNLTNLSNYGTLELLNNILLETQKITDDLKETNYEDLKNIVVEILQLLNKSKYLSTLE